VGATERGVAVFGSSEPRPGEAIYEQARTLGRLLAESGHVVVTGAYGGVMEAASRGAVEAGGAALGVTCAVFAERRPNRWVGTRLDAADLHERTRLLVERSLGFVVLEGKAGTLFELAALWALDRAGCLGRRPVVLLGRGWRELLRHLEEQRMLDRPQLELGTVVETPREAVRVLGQRLGAEG